MAHRIDVQHHLLPQAYVRAVGRDRIADTIVSNRCPDWTADLSLEAMDRNGITTAMLSLAAPGFHFGSSADAADLARLCNDEAAELCVRYSGRFGFFAALPLPHVAESLAEADRALDDLGADGICLLTNYGGHYLGDAQLAPVLEHLNARRTVAFVHPSDIEGGRPLPHL
ncbi:MAG: amidohydrolase family protein, partial [Pseudomonadota bacterium]|nr:amidohydrolase family protein [Pseudomonadota bacterium]